MQFIKGISQKTKSKRQYI